MKNTLNARPSHLFVGCSGELFDTRKPNWSESAPLRPDYEKTFSEIDTAAQLKATLRAGDTAWPGMYPLYFVTSDGGALSFATVRANLRGCLDAIKTGDTLGGWRICGCEVNWEDPDLYDDHTGKRIPSAYAEEDAEA